MPNMSKVKFLPLRTGIAYHDNRGYNLTLRNQPWGIAPYTVKRYRISKTENFDLVKTTSGKGGTLHLSNPLAPDALELIVLQKRAGDDGN
jgi:hypothetical protein